MSRRSAVTLVRAAATAATRRARFPADELLDAGGRRDATALSGALRGGLAVAGPARRCRQTARLAGFEGPSRDPAFADLDAGRWRGRELREIEREDPDGLAAWRHDPTSAPHGGESLADLAERVIAGLERLRGHPHAVVFTHAAVVRVAVLLALEAPLHALWRLDVAPAAVTELHARPGDGWRLAGCNLPPGGR